MAEQKKIKLNLRRVLLFGAVLFFIGVIISAVDWKLGSDVIKEIAIDIVKIDGKELINEDDVLRIIQKDANQRISDASVGKLDVPKIERKLKENPFVLNADVYLDAGNKLYVEIKQRKPILRVIDSKGRQYYLSEEGIKMPLSKHTVTRIIVATGNIPPYFEGYLENDNSMLSHLFELVNYIREDKFLMNLTEQIYIDKKDDFIIVPKVGHHQIILGEVKDLEEKFEKLKIFYTEALPYKGWKKYKLINLKFRDQVVTTRK